MGGFFCCLDFLKRSSREKVNLKTVISSHF
nr:MAG TPA: hypothetical protein [Caudoviricetes sp.]